MALPQYTKAVEKSRVTEARATLKSIAQAHDVFLLAHPGEMGDFSELDLSFTDGNGAAVTGHYFNTKNFQYTLGAGWCRDLQHHQIFAVRRNSSLTYGLGYCMDSGFICEDTSSGAVCKTLGMSKSATCISGRVGGNCWVE